MSKIEKVKTAKFVQTTVHTRSDEPKKDGMHNTLLGLLAAGNENCCLQEVKPVQQPASNVPPKPVDIFVDDEALKEQEAAARAAKAQQGLRREKNARSVSEKKGSCAKRKKRRRKRKKAPAGSKRLSTSFPTKSSRTTI